MNDSIEYSVHHSFVFIHDVALCSLLEVCVLIENKGYSLRTVIKKSKRKLQDHDINNVVKILLIKVFLYHMPI